MPSIQVQALRAGFSAGRATPNEALQDKQQFRRLEPGKPIERELAAGASHSYQLAIDAGQYAKLVVDQRGIDVVVQLLVSDGKKVLEFDSELRNNGKETVECVAEGAGGYRLTVRPRQKGAPAGSYAIRIEELRDATNDDRALFEARKLYSEFVGLYRAGKHDEAHPLIERALEIRESVLGLNHPDVAATLNSLAALYMYKSDYAKAEQLYQRALTIWEKSLGPEHPHVAKALNNLAVLYRDNGEHAKAEPMFQRALIIQEEALDQEHPEVAASLNNLATLYTKKGDYVRAEPLYQRALAIREKELGLEHPNVASLLNNLALLYRHRGDYEKAEQLYQRALTIWENALRPDHPVIPVSLNNLATLYGYKGDYEKAEQLYQRALTIWEKTLGQQHDAIAGTLNNLANLYRNKGDYKKAEPLFQRALTIFEKALGPDHPEVAGVHHNLANLYYDKGEYVKAEPLYQRALAIYEKTLGPQHRHVADALSSLAMLCAKMGAIAQAITYQSRANAVRERNLALNLAIGSERQKLAYLILFSKETDFTLSLHSQAAQNDPRALNLAFTTLLRRKGRGLDAMTDTIATLRRHSTPQDWALFDQLAEARSQLAALTFRESDSANSANDRSRLKTLEENVGKLEADLSARSAKYRAQAQPVTLAAVQAALPAGSALVEFAIYTPQKLKVENSKPPRYLAYVIAAQGRPNWVNLGEAAVIDRSIDTWRKALRNPNRTDVKKLARAIDEKLMRPLRPFLGKTRRLLIAPDGSLNLIPFAALVDEQQRYLIERYAISYLTSGGDLLRLQTSQASENAPMIVANPDFGVAETVVAQATRGSGALQPRSQGRTQNGSTRIYFQPLPSTRREALAIMSLLPDASVLVREQATESALKQARAPRILHIATHGFFLGDQEPPPAKTRGGFSDDPLRASDPRFSKWAANIENPLLRSGLALSGANQGKSGDEDGLLTALEVAGLDLWGTKLVALSACDTGVGEVRNGEGVQGLRRALVLAGSESQVMSLWPVADTAAKDLMIPYYKALLQGEGRSDGLRRAQLQMMRSKDRRHPFYWAAFIQSGEWANLNGQR